MNEYNILIKRSLNNELQSLKIVPLRERISYENDYTICQYIPINQTEYIFIDGKDKGETFIITSKIEGKTASRLDDIYPFCHPWKLIKYEETKELQ